MTPAQASNIINWTNFAATIPGVIAMDYLGRKTITIISQVVMIISLFGMFVFQQLIYNSTALILLCVVFIIGFGAGNGPVCFVYIAETNNNTATSINGVVQWIWTLVVAIITPPINNAFGGWQWLLYSGLSAIGLVYFMIEMKETRLLPKEQVQRLYEKKTDSSKTYEAITGSQQD